MAGAPQMLQTAVFGLRGDLASSVCYMQDNVVLYPSGHNLVLYNTETRAQRFIHGLRADALSSEATAAAGGGPSSAMAASPDAEERALRSSITAVAVSPNRQYVAVAERAQRGVISIFDAKTLKKRKMLKSPDVACREYLALAFAPDNKSLLSLGGGPDFPLVVWLWEQMKPALVTNLELTKEERTSERWQCSFCPADPSQVVVSGQRVVRWLSADATAQRFVPIRLDVRREEAELFGAHEWFRERSLIMATSSSRALLFEGARFVRSIAFPLEEVVERRANSNSSSAAAGVASSGAASAGSGAVGVAAVDDADAKDAALEPRPGDGSAAHEPSAASAAPLRVLAPMTALCAYSKGFVSGHEDGSVRVLLFDPSAESFRIGRSFYSSMADAGSAGDSDDVVNAAAVASTAVGTTTAPAVAAAATATTAMAAASAQLPSSSQPASSPTASSSATESAGGVSVRSPHAVTSVALSASEDNLLVSTASGQLLTLRMFDTDALKAEERKLEPVVEGFHCGPVTGLDVCVRKPLVVTCGADRTVRVWNYLEKTIELSKTFPDTPLTVTIHPSGLYIVVGFSDKLRVMSLLLDDIRVIKELPIKNCSECQFSHGGHAFAAVLGSVVLIYNFYTCECTHTIRDHNGAIKSVSWGFDDTSIVTAGWDGAVYQRRLSEGHRHQELVQKSCRYSSAVSSMDGKIYAVGDDRHLKEIVDSAIDKELDVGVGLTQVAISAPPQRMLFVGTETGVVRSYKFPLTGEFQDYVCHDGPVTRIRVSSDDAFLFSTSSDGSVAFFQIQEREGQIAKRERADAVPFSQEILVTKSDLEEKNAIMNDLRAQVDELTVQNAYQLRLHDIQYQEKLKEVTENFNIQLEHNRSKFEMLKDEKQDLELEFEEKLKQLQETQSRRLHQIDSEHQKSILQQLKVFRELEEALAAQQRDHERLSRQRELEHQEALEDVTGRYNRDLERERSAKQSVQNEQSLITRKFQETRNQLEQDTDKEIEELKSKYDTKLQLERDATLRLKGENGIMKKKFSSLKKDIEDQKEEIKAMAEKEMQLLQHIAQLEGEIRAHKQQIDERDSTIGEKETEIYSLKKDNQELEKFKFVLDFQIKELKRQIEPRENEIESMKESILKLDGELETFHKQNGDMEDEARRLTEGLSQKQAEVRQLRQRIREQQSTTERLLNDIEECVKLVQDPTNLKQRVTRMLREHGITHVDSIQQDPLVHAEYQRQRHYLEKSLQALKREWHSQVTSRRNDNMRIMAENVALIKEINDLRRRMKAMRLQQRQAETEPLRPKTTASTLSATGAPAPASRGGAQTRPSSGGRHGVASDDDRELARTVDLQRAQITALEVQLAELRRGKAKLLSRPVSRERLPPLDGAVVARS
jgi:WD40 repeat protein/chromosome segregation ATPase